MSGALGGGPPVIDIGAAVRGSISPDSRVVLEVAQACQEWGFFQCVRIRISTDSNNSTARIRVSVLYRTPPHISAVHGHTCVRSHVHTCGWTRGGGTVGSPRRVLTPLTCCQRCPRPAGLTS